MWHLKWKHLLEKLYKTTIIILTFSISLIKKIKWKEYLLWSYFKITYVSLVLVKRFDDLSDDGDGDIDAGRNVFVTAFADWKPQSSKS